MSFFDHAQNILVQPEGDMHMIATQVHGNVYNAPAEITNNTSTQHNYHNGAPSKGVLGRSASVCLF